MSASPDPPLSDLELSRAVALRPPGEIAAAAGIPEPRVAPYGRWVAKVSPGVLGDLADRQAGRYVVVTAVTPTPLGESKTATTIGLGQAFRHVGRRGVIAVRQPSAGPTFGIKGGAAGGGMSQIVPMETVNLHLTGDLHAVTAAPNLLAAMLDNHLHKGNRLGIDPYSISWRRVLDSRDRDLRRIVTGLGPRADGTPRETGFDITAASEVMAVPALSASLADLRDRLDRAENPDDVLAGGDNLRHRIAAVRAHGVMPVVAVNAFPTDFTSEHRAVLGIAAEEGARAVVAHHVAKGGIGAAELASAVEDACDRPEGTFRPLYPDDLPLPDEIEAVARRIYGAAGVDLSDTARRQLDDAGRRGFGNLSVCIAKTHLSVTADPSRPGAPTGWRLPVREVRVSAGAGFVTPLCGDISTMPGLSSAPAAERIDVLPDGRIVGLS